MLACVHYAFSSSASLPDTLCFIRTPSRARAPPSTITRSPAPHDYGTPSILKSTGGGQFSTAFPPTSLEATIRSKRGIPGPGSYRVQASSGKYVGKVPMARTPSEADRQVCVMASVYFLEIKKRERGKHAPKSLTKRNISSGLDLMKTLLTEGILAPF